ncbi:MAG: hypothetical protein HQL57_00865 [Magnetococcales bacterium]|nr:hypothetical protein [Magnetococcales bacterium]
MLQLIPYGIAAWVGGLLGRKYGPEMVDKGLANLGQELRTRTATNAIEILGETILEELPVILTVEEVPLDNRHGNKVLVSEHEFVKTASAGFGVVRDLGTTAHLKSGFWSTMEAMAQEEIKKSQRIEFGTQITRRVKIVFSTDPGHRVRYRVVWKQNSRKGHLRVRVDGKACIVPYVVTFGLQHGVESIAEG